MGVFPNPASGSFNVHADFLTEQGSATVRLYGPTGKLAMSTSMQGQEQRFAASNLRGLYMVVVEGNGKQLTHKLVLQ